MGVKHTSRSKFFIGREVEHTPLFGKDLLFVVGAQPIIDIIRIADDNYIKGIYLGADQSFNPTTDDEWSNWNTIVNLLIEAGFWVTLDFTVDLVEQVQRHITQSTHNKFIPMISVRIANANKFNYNTVIKIDDISFNSTNPGVWCWPLHNLMDRDCLTYWDEYANDQIIEDDEK